MVQYNGVNVVFGILLWYIYVGNEVYFGLSIMIFIDQFYIGGWVGDFCVVVCLYLEGFSVDVEDIILVDNKVMVFFNFVNEIF